MVRTVSASGESRSRFRREKRSSAHSRSASGSSPSNATESSPASRSSSSSTDTYLPSRELRELAVARPFAPDAEALLFLPAAGPAPDEGDHEAVQLLARDAAEQGSRDLRRPVETAAQVDVVGLLPAPLLVAHRRALEADVADPVLRARVRAAVEMQPQPLELPRVEPRLEQLHERAHARLRLGDREVAVRLAGAGDRVAGQRDAPERVDVDVADEHEVLLARDPRLVAELRERDQLVARDQTEVHRHPDPAVVDAEVVRRTRQRRQGEVVEAAPEPRLDAGAHALGPDVVDHELQPRLHPRDAVAQVLAPLVEDRRQHLDGLPLRHPDTELARDPRHRREAAADQHPESLLAVVERADERDAVDLRRSARIRAGGDRDLVLARQVRVIGVAVEEARRLLDHRPRVEQLALREPRHRTPRDVPHRVPARAGARQPGGMQALEHLRQRLQLDVVELDVLPRRQLRLPAPVEKRQLPDRAQLLRLQDPARDLHAQHERPDLRLVVVEPPPLQPDDVLLRHLLVAGRDQRRQLVEHPERALLPLQPLHRVALEDELERGLRHRRNVTSLCKVESRFRGERRPGARYSRVPSARWPIVYGVSGLSTPLLVLVFAAGAAATWAAGILLSKTTDALDARLGLGEELGGLLLLAVAGSLPELAITISAAAQGNLGLAAGNLIGGIAVQTMVLLVCDFAVGPRYPLTYLVGALSPVLEGLLVTTVVACVGMGSLLKPSAAIGGVVSPASVAIVVIWVVGIYVINRARKAPRWHVDMPGSEPGRRRRRDPHPEQPHPYAGSSTARVAAVFAGACAVTLVAGVALEASGNTLASHLGVNGVIFGATVLAAATALPEISSGIAAVRLGDNALAIGDIFGGNAFQVCLFLLADLIAQEPVLPHAGNDNAWLGALGMALTAIYGFGVIVRPVRTRFRLGPDSLLALAVFALGTAGLFYVHP